MNPISVPVLFLIFNRPEKTRQVFEAIREHQPRLLFIAADGPRNGIANEYELCEQARRVAAQVDWDCEVKTLFRTQNKGCRIAVSEAISWFFKHVEEGIILEDDCLPDQSFFPYCAELLEKYRYDTKVMSISGSNIQGRPWKASQQSYFRGYGGIWGWATWKRAWAQYDIAMPDWPTRKEIIKDAMRSQEWYESYYGMFDATFKGNLDTWDVQWFYCILRNEGIALNPCVNLVRNIGYDAGTHMNSAGDIIAGLTLDKMNFPIKHPENLEMDMEYLKSTYRRMHQKTSFIKRVKKRIRSLINHT